VVSALRAELKARVTESLKDNNTFDSAAAAALGALTEPRGIYSEEVGR
jgi:hypothetical protein